MKTAALIAPASPCDEKDVIATEELLKTFGIRSYPMKHVSKATRFTAGTDDERATDIMEAFSDPNIDLIVSLKGGYGTPRLLDRLDYSKIAFHKKPFFGFSDTTALQLALWQQAKMPSFSGFLGCFSAFDWPMLKTSLKACLDQQEQRFVNLVPLNTIKKTVTGVLIGGTLTLIASLCGTKYFPKTDGAIVFLEEVGEQPYHIDRMLNQLFLNGFFDRVSAVVLGGFHHCISKDPADGTVEDVLKERFSSLKVPVLQGLLYAHGMDHIILPIGGHGVLNPENGSLTCFSSFHEQGVSL